MTTQIALIGFGEAAKTFAPGLQASLCRFDVDPACPDLENVRRAASVEDALSGADAALSLVTADQALAAAAAATPHLRPGTFWFDMNSVAPDTKRAAALTIETSGAYYIDVAVMAPVNPGRMSVPLLLSGAQAEAAAAILRALGFAKVRVVPGELGCAAAIKMIRSVMVKGTEALTAECVLAADRAGVLNEVLASLDASAPRGTWMQRADYDLDRMLQHGLRRAAEMEEVVKTLDALGTGSTMSRGTVTRQRAIGALGATPPNGLAAKLQILSKDERTKIT